MRTSFGDGVGQCPEPAVVRQIYNQMLEPKCVVACGICACSGGVFRDAYNVIGGVDRAIPVDVYAPGCAIRPETVIDAIVEACGPVFDAAVVGASRFEETTPRIASTQHSPPKIRHTSNLRP